jgi:Nucleotidyltransferase domain
MRGLASHLATIPGVVAVTLGGSRATGTHSDDSDWDFGLYYRGRIDPEDVRALGWPGQVFAPGEWGRLVNGGAWLQVDGVAVDLIYRNLDEVLAWTTEAEHGRFEIQREVGYVAGIATYLLAGELAVSEVLHGALPRPSFPTPLRQAAPPRWYRLAAGAMAVGQVHASRGDRVAALANFTQAVLATAQGRLAARGIWVLNEKRIVERAGLARAHALLDAVDLDAAGRDLTELLHLPSWK